MIGSIIGLGVLIYVAVTVCKGLYDLTVWDSEIKRYKKRMSAKINKNERKK